MQVLDNFESSYSKFLDARQSWDSLEALQANTDILMPNGFKAFCKEEAKWYILTATDEADPSTYIWSEDGGTDEEAISLASTAITMVSEVDEKAEEALATAATAIAAIDNIGSDETKLDKVSEMPAEHFVDDTVLYIGETTENYIKGHIYQYQENKHSVTLNLTIGSSYYTADLSSVPESYPHSMYSGWVLNSCSSNEELRNVFNKGILSFTSTDENLTASTIENGPDEYEIHFTDSKYEERDASITIISEIFTGWVDISINDSDETKLDKVSTIPAEPSDGDTVLFVGITTENYKKGHIYQYSETDTEWKDLTSAGFSIENLALAFNTSTSYDVDTIVTYNDELYICTTEHAAGEWSSEDFTKTTVSELLSNINEKAEEALATAATAIAAANNSSPTLTENITPNVEVGGIGVGDTLTTGQQITDVLKKLLVKYFEPVITLSADKVLINKKGATIEAPITITATAEKKSDDVIFYSINYDGNDVSTGNNPDGGEITYIHQTDISADTIFIGSISDGKSTINKTIKFEFINPYYYGSANDNEISDFTGLTEEIVKKNINKKVNYTASAEYLVFAYDATYGDLTSIKDKNNFENLPAFTKTVMEVNGENYNVYISSDKITCSNFEYTFKI